ncbi:glycosyltransferase 61 family protein [Synechococcus sp. A10-1-5-9]|uniref:glycosyltransferase 61 family protein n=1 Tax=Synechococcus sp. A10-1-5-9 TaxID=3392295 RepID=UPI0039EC76E8
MNISLYKNVLVYDGVLFDSNLVPIHESTILSNLPHRKDNKYHEDQLKSAQSSLKKLFASGNASIFIKEFFGPCFWAYYPWDKNPQHFIIETLPRILLMIKEAGVTPGLLFLNNNLINSEIATFAMREAPCLLAPTGKQYVYKLSECYVSSNININFVNTSPLGAELLRGFRSELVNSSLSFEAKIAKDARVYVDRISSPLNNAPGRTCINQSEVRSSLLSNGFSIVATEDMGFYNRVTFFSECSEMMSVSGANLMNSFFTGKRISKIHHLVHPAFIGNCAWFKGFFEDIVGAQNFEHLILDTDSSTGLTFKEFMSLPFKIEIQSLNKIIS